jgi:enoyl-CoA hydratase/carnithine racemase
MTGFIQVVREAGTVSLFLNRPERRNALSLALLAELSTALSNEVREDTTAVIISGVNGYFSAGGDLSDMTGTPADLRIDDAIEEVTRKIQELPVPVIAAIDGPCLGGAFDLALSCDHRIAAKDAFFQVPAARLGLLYNPRAIVRMRQRLGRDGVFRVLVLGEHLNADEAFQAGIVSHVVEGPSHDAALKTAHSAGGNIRSAVGATKHLLNAIDSMDYDPAEWEERRREMMSSPEREKAVLSERKRRGYDS